ncbi:MAG TPA: hypothetical protein PKE21_11110 [Flavobacteriales bacterium]|nr:hypothetical protein [Flavobacteriales bacterium]HMR28018.1 hypothetical protein [Flavobacteriales bacterium]
MKLDRTTYEAWLLDRLEGALSAAQLRELDDFLRANPDLAAEAERMGIEWPKLEADAPHFPDKDTLKRALPPQGLPTAAKLQDFLVALVEGDLTGEQHRALQAYLELHPEARNDARLMALARIAPGPASLPGRSDLRRSFPPTGVVDRHRLSDFLIAEVEGELGAQERKALQAYLAAHPEAERERRLVAATRILPGAATYPGRAGLYKREGRVVPLFGGASLRRLAAAASVALLLGLGIWALTRGPQPTDVQLAERPSTPAPAQRQRAQEAIPSVGPQEAVPPIEHPASSTTGASRSEGATNADGMARSTGHDRRNEPPQPAPARDLTMLARVEPAHPTLPQAATPAPVSVKPVVPAPLTPAPEELLATTAGGAQAPPTLAGLLAQRVRGEVLEQRDPDARPLDEADAVAAVDKGLKRLGGAQAGLDVQRNGRRLTRLDLRLGNGLAFTASRGR